MEPLLALEIWGSWWASMLLMVIGFGAVVFFHELGHFLVAKRAGIKVEEFALGFGKKLWSFRHGDTEYRLNLIPLGGYVKMLGQEDFKPNEEYEDPRAYANKSVPARLAVVSAGVIMNVVLAALLFVIIFMVGIRFNAPQVGQVVPGLPAATVKLPDDLGTGLKPGDEILAINGDRIDRFEVLLTKAALSDADDRFRMTIRRPMEDGTTRTFEARLGTAELERNNSRLFAFGISAPADRVIAGVAESTPYVDYGVVGEGFGDGDVIVEYAGQPIEHGWQITRMNDDLGAGPIDVVVERTDPQTGQAARHTVTMQPFLGWSDAFERHWLAQAAEAQASDAEPPSPPEFNVLGLHPRLRIQAVVEDSPADEAGLQPGDVVLRYGDPPVSPGRNSTVHRVSQEYAGQPAPIWVQRDGQELEPIQVQARQHKGRTLVGIALVPDARTPVVAEVDDQSPLAGQVPAGATLSAIDDTPVESWSDAVSALTARMGEAVVLHYRTAEGQAGTTEPLTLTEELFRPAWYAHRLELPRKVLQGPEMQTFNPLRAAAWGVRETGHSILQAYATLRAALVGRVSAKEFSGPIGIFHAGVVLGSRGPIWVIWLMAIISANLAVINFLPLPIVDGGHAVFLIIEGIRRKPLSLRVMNAVQMAGLVLIIAVFLAITYNDIARIFVNNAW